MKCFIITHRGIENIASKEIEDLIKVKSKIEETVAIFDCKKNDLHKLCYKGQTFIKVLEFISAIDVDDEIEEKIMQELKNVKVGKTFRIKCKRIGKHNFSSSDIEQETGKPIFDNNKTKVDLHNPETIIYIYVYNKKCYIGKDLSTVDLSKRDYKIFVHPASIKGTIAAALIKVAGFTNKKALLDPFCGSGTIPIEAAFFAGNFSQNYFTKNKFLFKIDLKEEKPKKLNIYGYDMHLKHTFAARKNAKIAGVEDSIKISKSELSWLDTKLKEKEIDVIVTDPPRMNKNIREKDYASFMKELFYQSKYLLKDKGNITLLTNSRSLEIMEKEAKNHDFVVHELYDIYSGEEGLIIVKFIKGK